jgi:hypothetical protein
MRKSVLVALAAIAIVGCTKKEKEVSKCTVCTLYVIDSKGGEKRTNTNDSVCGTATEINRYIFDNSNDYQVWKCK